MRHDEVRTRNVVLTDSHWLLSEKHLTARTIETQGKRRQLLPSQIYGRHLLKALIQTLIRTGMRPMEATSLLKWKDVAFKTDLRHNIDENMDRTCVISVNNPLGKGSRKVVADAGLILRLWMQECERFRLSVGLHKLQRDHLVFGNPMTGIEYEYRGISNQFRAVLKELGLDDLGYTIRSTRSFYITKMLSAGKPAYLVAKNVGHSMDVMRKHYEQLSVDDLLKEFGE